MNSEIHFKHNKKTHELETWNSNLKEPKEFLLLLSESTSLKSTIYKKSEKNVRKKHLDSEKAPMMILISPRIKKKIPGENVKYSRWSIQLDDFPEHEEIKQAKKVFMKHISKNVSSAQISTDQSENNLQILSKRLTINEFKDENESNQKIIKLSSRYSLNIDPEKNIENNDESSELNELNTPLSQMSNENTNNNYSSIINNSINLRKSSIISSKSHSSTTSSRKSKAENKTTNSGRSIASRRYTSDSDKQILSARSYLEKIEEKNSNQNNKYNRKSPSRLKIKKSNKKLDINEKNRNKMLKNLLQPVTNHESTPEFLSNYVDSNNDSNLKSVKNLYQKALATKSYQIPLPTKVESNRSISPSYFKERNETNPTSSRTITPMSDTDTVNTSISKDSNYTLINDDYLSSYDEDEKDDAKMKKFGNLKEGINNFTLPSDLLEGFTSNTFQLKLENQEKSSFIDVSIAGHSRNSLSVKHEALQRLDQIVKTIPQEVEKELKKFKKEQKVLDNLRIRQLLGLDERKLVPVIKEIPTDPTFHPLTRSSRYLRKDTGYSRGKPKISLDMLIERPSSIENFERINHTSKEIDHITKDTITEEKQLNHTIDNIVKLNTKSNSLMQLPIKTNFKKDKIQRSQTSDNRKALFQYNQKDPKLSPIEEIISFPLKLKETKTSPPKQELKFIPVNTLSHKSKNMKSSNYKKSNPPLLPIDSEIIVPTTSVIVSQDIAQNSESDPESKSVEINQVSIESPSDLNAVSGLISSSDKARPISHKDSVKSDDQVPSTSIKTLYEYMMEDMNIEDKNTEHSISKKNEFDILETIYNQVDSNLFINESNEVSVRYVQSKTPMLPESEEQDEYQQLLEVINNEKYIPPRPADGHFLKPTFSSQRNNREVSILDKRLRKPLTISTQNTVRRTQTSQKNNDQQRILYDFTHSIFEENSFIDPPKDYSGKSPPTPEYLKNQDMFHEEYKIKLKEKQKEESSIDLPSPFRKTFNNFNFK